jgi:hypothetical protein
LKKVVTTTNTQIKQQAIELVSLQRQRYPVVVIKPLKAILTTTGYGCITKLR